jgi:F1F0 ATPase subunit 2
MNDIAYLITVFIGGLIMGTLYFGGLWFTVKKTLSLKNTALWIIGSYFLRISITMVGFYYLASSSWQRLLICLLGFIVARYIVVSFTKSIDKKQLLFKKKESHEA